MTERILHELHKLPAVLDREDLRALLRISKRGIDRILADPELHAWKEDGEWNVLRSDLIEWLEKQQ